MDFGKETYSLREIDYNRYG